jgi:hypothetical protein
MFVRHQSRSSLDLKFFWFAGIGDDLRKEFCGIFVTTTIESNPELFVAFISGSGFSAGGITVFSTDAELAAISGHRVWVIN